jgi:hypothetical protein
MSFTTIPTLANAIDPTSDNNAIEDILNGTFTDHCKEWMNDLRKVIDQQINTHISTQDFIYFFKKRKEKMASSSSGRHMGHYKVIADLASRGNTMVADIMVMIINISLHTARPLARWRRSAQVMIEKSKGRFIENL